MKKVLKSILGVTLLEVMLVLAIAAMIIVMSIRYFQSASYAQQSNAVLQQVTAIVAAAGNLTQGTGSFSTITSTVVVPLLPANGLKTPWGGITISGAPTTLTMTVKSVPAGACGLIKAKVTSNSSYSSNACNAAPSTTDLAIVYTSNK